MDSERVYGEEKRRREGVKRGEERGEEGTLRSFPFEKRLSIDRRERRRLRGLMTN